jgi:enoyl-CoA hydratase
MSEPETVLVERHNRLAILHLNRPEALNALNPELLCELADKLHELDADPDIACLILTGKGKAFAAGADIKAMADLSAMAMVQAHWMERWASVRQVKKPLIAAVNGYALGGGCELAMACDLIIASETAKFGQPEISLGVIPGAGGTQRLTRTVGKAKAMELILTGRPFSAQEALEMGLINRVVPSENVLEEALALATIIAEKPVFATRLAKEAILEAFESPLEQGLLAEKQRFALCFGTADQREGMQAFQEKRSPHWQH